MSKETKKNPEKWKKKFLNRGFPGGTSVKNPQANAGEIRGRFSP